MALQKPVEETFVLGNWTVHPAFNCLSMINNPSRRVLLEPRLMHLLCFLAANKDTVLSREQLTAELWPRVIVNENSLTRAVSELRKKLNVDPKVDVTYIETIPKKGYLLNPDLVGQPNAMPMLASSSKISARKNGLRRFLSGWQPTLTATSLVLALAMSVNPTLVTDSLDGAAAGENLVADQIIPSADSYSALRTNLELAGSHSQLVTDSTTEFVSPLISKNGKSMAYLRHDGNGSTIYFGSSNSVADLDPVYNSPALLYNLSWSPLGDALLFAARPVKMTTALLDSAYEEADLLMLDLQSFEVSVLIDSDAETTEIGSENGINLT